MVNLATIGRIKVFFGVFFAPGKEQHSMKFFPPIFRHVGIWCSTVHLLLKYHRRVIRIYICILQPSFLTISLQIMKTPTVCYSVYGYVCVAGDLHMAGTSTRENGLKETITLKWCTPRTNSVGEQSQLKSSCFLETTLQKSFHYLFSCDQPSFHCPFRAVLLHRSLSHLPHRRKQSALVMFDKLPSER